MYISVGLRYIPVGLYLSILKTQEASTSPISEQFCFIVNVLTMTKLMHALGLDKVSIDFILVLEFLTQ